MSVIGAVRSFSRNVSCRDGRLHRFAPGAVHIAGLSVLRMQFAFALQPMRRLKTVRFARILPNLIGSPGDAFVTD